MLVHLSIRNFAVVKSLDLELQDGMTAITGETGAGKSIAIDALGLCLGDRADAGMVRPGAEKAEITASFGLQNNPSAKQWLVEHELDTEETECMVRRVISSEGRSRAFINGSPAPLQLLKDLGQYLIAIHGQHAHQALLKQDYQRRVLDGHAQLHAYSETVSKRFKSLQRLNAQHQELLASQQQRDARKQLLDYQVAELDEFGIGEFEFEELEGEFKRLSNSQALLEQSQRSYHQLYADDNVNALDLIQQSLEQLTDLQQSDPALAPIVTMLNDASIQVSEAATELRDYFERLDIDPMRIEQVENRYANAMELARKHHIQPEQLYQLHMRLADELRQLQQEEGELDDMDAQVALAQTAYREAAQALSQKRQKSAAKLSKEIQSRIQKMNMSQARFAIEVTFNEQAKPSTQGLDSIRFTVSTNPGLPLDSLDKVVSGGELSRIGLAVQVIGAADQAVPTLIFDEVDTGISGPTAAIVGQLLREIGAHSQVMCVTHLPQVAASAHHQFFVTKFSDKKTTETHIQHLDEQARVQELARLLAGDTLTESAIANARELLTAKQSNRL